MLIMVTFENSSHLFTLTFVLTSGYQLHIFQYSLPAAAAWLCICGVKLISWHSIHHSLGGVYELKHWKNKLGVQ
jgi:hypothetical protein